MASSERANLESWRTSEPMNVGSRRKPIETDDINARLAGNVLLSEETFLERTVQH